MIDIAVTVRVSVQLFENKNFNSDSDGTPKWIPKMTHEFLFENVDYPTVHYAKDLKSVLCELVQTESDNHNKFEYLSHEVTLFQPTKLSSNSLEQAIINQHDIK
jgi:hypothetical protein